MKRPKPPIKVDLTLQTDQNLHIGVYGPSNYIGTLVVDVRGVSFMPRHAKKTTTTRLTWAGLHGLLTSGALAGEK